MTLGRKCPSLKAECRAAEAGAAAASEAVQAAKSLSRLLPPEGSCPGVLRAPCRSTGLFCSGQPLRFGRKAGSDGGVKWQILGTCSPGGQLGRPLQSLEIFIAVRVGSCSAEILYCALHLALSLLCKFPHHCLMVWGSCGAWQVTFCFSRYWWVNAGQSLGKRSKGCTVGT